MEDTSYATHSNSRRWRAIVKVKSQSQSKKIFIFIGTRNKTTKYKKALKSSSKLAFQHQNFTITHLLYLTPHIYADGTHIRIHSSPTLLYTGLDSIIWKAGGNESRINISGYFYFKQFDEITRYDNFEVFV